MSLIHQSIKRNRNIEYFRDYKNFNRESSLTDLHQIDWNAMIDGSELGLYTESVINTIGEITNRHARIPKIDTLIENLKCVKTILKSHGD